MTKKNSWIPLSPGGTAKWSSWTQILQAAARIWKPEVFHGVRRLRRFFEGWYYKLVGPDGRERLAVIPGVALSGRKGESLAFIQVMDGSRRSAEYLSFPMEECAFDPACFGFRIGANEFRADRLCLAGSPDGRLPRGVIELRNNASWPVTLAAPGVMGPYAFAPWMECYHGVLSFRADLHGALEHHGQKLEFTHGRGYLEKDWGASFPTAYIWLQANHFTSADASLMVSVARIPWLGRWFAGFASGFWLAGRLYRFATYTGAGVTRFEIRPSGCSLEFMDRRYVLRVEAEGAEPGERLRSPVAGSMSGQIRESLSAQARVELAEVGTGRVCFSGESRYGGFEREGDLTTLAAGFALATSH